MSSKSEWSELVEGFRLFLKLEKSLSANSIDAYLRDVSKLENYCAIAKITLLPQNLSYKNISDFVIFIHQLGVSNTSQARIISGIRAFYKYLLIEDLINEDPTALLEGPKLKRTLPDILTIDEIDSMVNCIDLSDKHGQRNKTIIEVLYGCGLRVSELCDLKISNINFEDEFIKVKGKGLKERLVPLGKPAANNLKLYLTAIRNTINILNNFEDYVFINNRGKNYSRVMIFYIIKELTKNAGVTKIISPHTLRHSFASHMVDGGADLRAVQEMLGHESIVTTEIYTHIDNSYLRDAIIQFHPRGKF
jgi:integrase/recombinase XerD